MRAVFWNVERCRTRPLLPERTPNRTSRRTEPLELQVADNGAGLTDVTKALVLFSSTKSGHGSAPRNNGITPRVSIVYRLAVTASSMDSIVFASDKGLFASTLKRCFRACACESCAIVRELVRINVVLVVHVARADDTASPTLRSRLPSPFALPNLGDTPSEGYQAGGG